MARRVTFDQDPIAVFLDYQLPQMIAQSREAEKNRVHEKDILQERQKIEQENFLLETQTTRGLKDLDALTKDIEAQEKYEIVVVPTIIVFNGKEVKRFQADISFTMKATKKDVQAAVDDILMSDF